MQSKNELPINWINLLVSRLEENWQKFVKTKATIVFPPENKLTSDSEQLDWALQFSLAEAKEQRKSSL